MLAFSAPLSDILPSSICYNGSNLLALLSEHDVLGTLCYQTNDEKTRGFSRE